MWAIRKLKVSVLTNDNNGNTINTNDNNNNNNVLHQPRQLGNHWLAFYATPTKGNGHSKSGYFLHSRISGNVFCKKKN